MIGVARRNRQVRLPEPSAAKAWRAASRSRSICWLSSASLAKARSSLSLLTNSGTVREAIDRFWVDQNKTE